MLNKKYVQIISLITSLAIIGVCFTPWVHYNSINTTFTGFNVKRFSTGVYYGRAGIIITIFAGISFLCTLLPYVFFKRLNMFLTAFLLAYTLRTYVIFTGSLFDGEVETKAGIYLINILALVMLLCSIFPNLKEKQ
jgi:hypothetical protein